MESLFVGQKKVATLIKSCRKYLYDVFNDMTEDFFFSKVIWKHYLNETFLHTFFSVTGPTIFGRKDQEKNSV